MRAAIVTVVTGVLVGVVVAVVSARIPTPKPPEPTRVAVSTVPPSSRVPSGSSSSPGATVAGRWTNTPVTLRNDYLSATFSMDPAKACQGGTGWVFGAPAAQLPALPFSDDADQWASTHGGIPATDNYISVVVQGLNGHTVIVTKIGVRVLDRKAPTAVTHAHMGGGCGGITPSSFRADLDTPAADLDTVAVEGDGVGTPAPAVPLPHRVSESDPEQWQITLHTTTCDCTVLPYVEWTSDAASGRFDLALPTGAWEVSAPGPGAHDAEREDDAGHWVTY